MTKQQNESINLKQIIEDQKDHAEGHSKNECDLITDEVITELLQALEESAKALSYYSTPEASAWFNKWGM